MLCRMRASSVEIRHANQAVRRGPFSSQRSHIRFIVGNSAADESWYETPSVEIGGRWL